MIDWTTLGMVMLLDTSEKKTAARRMFYEHIKRRPNIDYVMEPERQAVWDEAQKRLPLLDQRVQPVFGFAPKATDEEKYIINTPIETLMADFEKTL